MTYAAFTPDTCSPDTNCIHLYPFVSPVAVYTYPVGLSATKLSRRHVSTCIPLQSYLTGRSQVYRVASASVSVPLCFGVPQESIVGSSQFVSYTEDIQEVIPLSYHLYADDTQLLASTTIHSIGECRRDFEHCVVSVQRWCAARRLQFNADKDSAQRPICNVCNLLTPEFVLQALTLLQ